MHNQSRGSNIYRLVLIVIFFLAFSPVACRDYDGDYNDNDDNDDNDDDDQPTDGSCFYICHDDDYCVPATSEEECQQYSQQECSNLQQLDFVSDCDCERYSDCSPGWYY